MAYNNHEVTILRTMEIEPNRSQPRKNFDNDAIAELAQSIKHFGIIQPVVVRQLPNGVYRIVAGERRWRAARMAGLEEIPVIIRTFSDIEETQISLIENLLREDLNPLEEAMGYKELMDKYNMTHEEISDVFGCSRSYITNSLRLLYLPKDVCTLLAEGKISVGHAKLLLSCNNEKTISELAVQCAEGNLTVKQLDKLIKSIAKTEKNPKTEKRDSFYREMELSLKEILGRKISIKNEKSGRGTIILEYYDKEDLSAIADTLAAMSSSDKL